MSRLETAFKNFVMCIFCSVFSFSLATDPDSAEVKNLQKASFKATFLFLFHSVFAFFEGLFYAQDLVDIYREEEVRSS